MSQRVLLEIEGNKGLGMHPFQVRTSKLFVWLLLITPDSFRPDDDNRGTVYDLYVVGRDTEFPIWHTRSTMAALSPWNWRFLWRLWDVL